MSKQYGKPVCFGADPRWATLPISNLPADTVAVRRRIREKNFARAYVKTVSGIQEWWLAPDGTFTECQSVRLAYFKGANSITK